MSLNIKNPEAERLAAEVGALTGESKTAAVITALRERRERLLAQRQEAADTAMADDLLALAEKIRSRIGKATLSTESLYDPETGLPA
ncbi:type II toxin-antitoxin system VapB family antitoxin [Thermoactinospora rubra]|uniref:type II toxin-antitoxin system VapB family antitoxin n=1 Tax=Thermoactinospora rubra TaxID=1088767 RepID=UPI000A108118|nr:type II toxin-antitoxin system VapB family antitoxin [Thermoactinospora rubra]